MYSNVRELLLGTLDPSRVQASTDAIQKLKGSPEFANMLYSYMLDASNDEQTRYLASIYFSQIFRSPLSHEKSVLMEFSQSTLHCFCTLPLKIRRVIKDCLAVTLNHLYQCGKLPNLYSDCASILYGVLRENGIDPLTYQGVLTPDVLCILSDVIFLMLPFPSHAATVELDDTIALKLKSIIGSTSELIISLLTMATTCYVASLRDQASFIAYQSFLHSLYSFLMSMYSLDDLPTIYNDKYLYIATSSVTFLDLRTLASQGFNLTDPIVAEVCKKILSMLCNSISAHNAELEAHAANVIKLLIDMACNYVAVTEHKTFNMILTDILFHLHFFAEGLESQKYIYANAPQLMNQVIFSALRLTASDFEAIEEEDHEYVCGLLSIGDSTSRRSACEGILRTVCRALPEARGVAMQKAQESIASLGQGQGTLDWFVSLCQALAFYRAVVIQQVSKFTGVSLIISDSNFNEFYATVIAPSLRLPYLASSTEPMELSAAKTLALCEIMHFVTDFRNIMTEEQFSEGLQALLRCLSCSHNNVSNSVLSSCLSTILKNCKHTSVVAQLEPQFIQLLHTFLSSSGQGSSTCLLLHSGTNDVYVANAFSAVLRLVSQSMTIDALVELVVLFFSFVFPTCLQRKDRLKFVHKLFESLVIILNVISDRAISGIKTNSEVVNQMIKLFASLYSQLENEEDWLPIYFQLLSPLMQIAALTDAFTEAHYPVLFKEILPMYINAASLQVSASIPAYALAMNSFVSLAVAHNRSLLNNPITAPDGTSTSCIQRVVQFGSKLVTTSNFRLYGYGVLTNIASLIPECVPVDAYANALDVAQKELSEIQMDRKLLGAVCHFFAQYACSCDPSTMNSAFIVEELLTPFTKKAFLRDSITKDIVVLLTKLPVNQLDEAIKWDVLRCIGVLGGLVRRKIDLCSRSRVKEGEATDSEERMITDGSALFVELKEVRGTWPTVPVPQGFSLAKHITDTIPFDFKNLSA
ncbi:hypothetical protein GL50803_0017110 [Giardia duodenalis]|uniref:Uncharacterized protein n=1 Tax=Giardia intestinalis (strain ATCC 50803 / WB clone C6) TaxID=184922 RepID=A8BJ67_GIAIC|nr:hypothetical protein GL50803_0017110 [Giardia intestinalis]KAE8304869.1 hypothetical protein GL50803_0017110 [Giardia intestinalis]|eukprot:XP_001706751.1 Hypothetical protein GL50803_17110 [Giardia lamblia ATCC 50803]